MKMLCKSIKGSEFMFTYRDSIKSMQNMMSFLKKLEDKKR